MIVMHRRLLILCIMFVTEIHIVCQFDQLGFCSVGIPLIVAFTFKWPDKYDCCCQILPCVILYVQLSIMSLELFYAHLKIHLGPSINDVTHLSRKEGDLPKGDVTS